jgi:hypothetical protein
MLALSLGRATGTEFCAGQGAECGHGLHLARAWETLVDERFAQGLGRWQVHNYRNALKIDVAGDAAVGHRLAITRSERETDTAFELTSQPVTVVGGGDYRLTLRARHDMDLSQAAGHERMYFTEIRWLDAGGQAAGSTQFDLGPANDAWHVETVAAQAPQPAVAAVIRIGFDSPNLHGGHHLELAAVTVERRQEPAAYVNCGELLSRPLLLPVAASSPMLSWMAELPQGTNLQFQVRSAPGDDSGPGKWTAFSGPDGTAKSFYTASGLTLSPVHSGHRWFQYRAALTTSKPVRTPVLRAVRLSSAGHSVADTDWTGPDRTSPALVDYTPRRTEDARGPLVFTVRDNSGGVGVDLQTVEAMFDGQSITALLKRGAAAGQFRYELAEPLKRPVGLAALGEWAVENYQSALTIGPADRPDSVVVRRNAARDDTAFRIASPLVSVREGAEYRVSFWSRHAMRLRGVGADGRHFGNGVRWLDAKGQEVGQFSAFDLGDATPAWHQDQLTLTAPPGARSAVMTFGWDSPDLFGGAEVAFAEPRFDGPHPDVPTGPNLHRVTVRAADLAGNVLERDWWILVAPRPRSGIVTIRDDGVVLVDGRPLFPIGMYAVWKREHNQDDFERCFAELKAAGFNTAHTYNAARTPELREFYATATRHGFKVIIASRAGSNNPDPRVTVSDVAAEACEPSLLAWYLADDTASHISAQELRRVHEAVKDVDPFHVTVQADGVHGSPTSKSRYTDYVPSTDAFLPELYPIRSPRQAEVADIIRDMKAIAADCRRAGRNAPVWAIIQDFQGWGWERFPTDAELRAMTWLAIIHGATGMTYYTYGGHGKNHGATHDPQVWANLKQTAGELASLHDVLVQRDPPQRQRVEILAGPKTDRLGHPAVSTRLKIHEGRQYLLTANSANATVRAKIAIPAVGAKADVLWEKRTVGASSGTVEDEFRPYAVHVYRW